MTLKLFNAVESRAGSTANCLDDVNMKKMQRISVLFTLYIVILSTMTVMI